MYSTHISSSGIDESNIPHNGLLFRQYVKKLTDRMTATNILATVCIGTYAFTSMTNWNLLKGSLYIPKVLQGEVWRIFTHCILHKSMSHLLANIGDLFYVGPHIERKWGIVGLIKIAIFSNTVNIVREIIFKSEQHSVGLSCITYGMIGAWSIILTREQGIAWGLSQACLLWGANSIMGTVIKDVDHSAHVAGYLAGVVFGLSN